MLAVCLVFTIPLHAARIKGHGSGYFSAFKPYPVPNYKESYRGSLISFSPCSPNKGKRNNTQDKGKRNNTQVKGKEHSVYPARPLPPLCGPKLRLTSIPYIHRGGLRSRVLARGLDPPRSSWALRSPVVLLLFCQPTRWVSLLVPSYVVWVGRGVVGRPTSRLRVIGSDALWVGGVVIG